MKDNPYEAPAPYDAALAEDPHAMASSAAMRHSMTVFRGLLLLYPILIVVSIIAAFALEAYLPEELRLYAEAQADAPLTGTMMAIAVLALFSLLVDLVGWLGMLFFWRPSRWIFLASQVLFLAVTVVFGPSVSHGLTDAADSAGAVVAGAILAMAFYSPVRERFARKAIP